MSNSFFNYLQRLELMAFFSAFPLIYALAYFIAGKKKQAGGWKKNLVQVLPYTYALTGTLYLGLQLKNLYPDYSIAHINQAIPSAWLSGWALLSILFWIPAIAKKDILSFIHSLVFFFFLARDLFLHSAGKMENSMLRNTMNVYTNSFLLNLLCLSILFGISYFLFSRKPLDSGQAF